MTCAILLAFCLVGKRGRGERLKKKKSGCSCFVEPLQEENFAKEHFDLCGYVANELISIGLHQYKCLTDTHYIRCTNKYQSPDCIASSRQKSSRKNVAISEIPDHFFLLAFGVEKITTQLL